MNAIDSIGSIERSGAFFFFFLSIGLAGETRLRKKPHRKWLQHAKTESADRGRSFSLQPKTSGGVSNDEMPRG